MSRRSRLSISGIYTLTNAVSGTVYVGQARNIRKRWEVHRSTLERGKHRNGYLQRAWNKYGAAAFRFEVILDLSNTPKDDLGRRLNEEEIAALRRFPDTYNLMEAGWSGTIASDSTRKLLSHIRQEMWADPLLRARIVAAMKERAADPEHQKRRGEGIAAYRNTPEAKAAVSAHMTNLWTDPDHRAEQSARRTANWQDEAYRAQQSASRAATWQDPEVRAKRDAGMRASWQNPEKRALRLAKFRETMRRKAAATQAELPALDRE